MVQLRQDYSKFQALDTEVIVVGPEDKDAFKQYWKTHKFPFIGLADPTYSVLKRYGQEVNLFKLGRLPAQVLIDKQGIARFVHYGRAMSDIPENEEILQVLQTLNTEKVQKQV